MYATCAMGFVINRQVDRRIVCLQSVRHMLVLGLMLMVSRHSRTHDGSAFTVSASNAQSRISRKQQLSRPRRYCWACQPGASDPFAIKVQAPP
jgi:hypothetical protein